jgi:CBS-domain-containing membrane protein
MACTMIVQTFLRTLAEVLGIERFHISHTERIVSAAGAFCGILVTLLISRWYLPEPGAFIIIASMGASAVLLFAVPHGALSQPWPVAGGHFISAIIGVSIAKLITPVWLAAPVAVGLAVGTMHYLRCIHPPGGATALAATTSGAQVTAMGYHFVFTPVMLNVCAILLVAVTFNYLFMWRRYPVWLNRRRAAAENLRQPDKPEAIAHEDFVFALSQIDSIVDITENELLRIYDLVIQNHDRTHLHVPELKLGHYYSNGKFGDQWSVRQIVDWADDAVSAERKLIYKTVAGADRRNSGVCSTNEFASWASNEVERDEQNWRLVQRERN